MWLLMVCAVILFVCLSTTSWAYRIKILNKMSPEDAPFQYSHAYTDFTLYYGIGGYYSSSLFTGKTWEWDNSDWKSAGTCWSSLDVRMPGWPDCPKDNRFINKNLDKCQNITILFTGNKANCSINFTILNE